MGMEINLLDMYPKSKRPIKERASLITERHRKIARNFDKDFFDGDRLTGYGGYSYDSRFWRDTVERIVDFYDLPARANVLDVGCAKGFMMYDMSLYRPDLNVEGVDISEYACRHAKAEVLPKIRVANASNLPFRTNSFDLVISINTLHNLPILDCKQAIREVMRVSKKDAFIVMDAWRNDREKEALLAWNLTAMTYMHVDNWKKLFSEMGYTGDYYWFFAVTE